MGPEHLLVYFCSVDSIGTPGFCWPASTARVCSFGKSKGNRVGGCERMQFSLANSAPHPEPLEPQITMMREELNKYFKFYVQKD